MTFQRCYGRQVPNKFMLLTCCYHNIQGLHSALVCSLVVWLWSSLPSPPKHSWCCLCAFDSFSSPGPFYPPSAPCASEPLPDGRAPEGHWQKTRSYTQDELRHQTISTKGVTLKKKNSIPSSVQIISEGKQLFPLLPFLQGISINSCMSATALTSCKILRQTRFLAPTTINIQFSVLVFCQADIFIYGWPPDVEMHKFTADEFLAGQAGQFLVMNGTFIGKGFYFHLTGMFLII